MDREGREHDQWDDGERRRERKNLEGPTTLNRC